MFSMSRSMIETSSVLEVGRKYSIISHRRVSSREFIYSSIHSGEAVFFDSHLSILRLIIMSSTPDGDQKLEAEGASEKSVKPALKKSPHGHKKGVHLKWDEEVIEEHNELRGTRMKIEEPNTPYHNYDSGAESESSVPKSPGKQQHTEISWDVLQNKLDSVAAVRAEYPSSPSEYHDSDVEEDQKKEMRKREFKEHRKRHYNEMEAVRKFRQEHPDDVEEAAADADVED